ILPFQLCTVGIERERFENPPDGEPQVADARLSVHSGSVRRDAVQFLHGSFLAQSRHTSTNCQSPSRPRQNDYPTRIVILNESASEGSLRQQLQVLRDLGLLEFLGGGSYRLL